MDGHFCILIREENGKLYCDLTIELVIALSFKVLGSFAYSTCAIQRPYYLVDKNKSSMGTAQ